MANGSWVGEPAPEKTCWGIELPDHRGFEAVHARSVRIDGGAAVFTNGALATLEVVAIYGPMGYVWIGPVPNEHCKHLGQP